MQFDFMENLDESTKIEIKNNMASILAEMKISNEEKFVSAARRIGLTDNFIQIMQMERQYSSAKREWDQYQNWKKTRNQKRSELEEKYGYDCYVEETEFLTKNGWKSFDDISEKDELATVYTGSSKHRKYLGIEYQKYTEKFDCNFTGNLYNMYAYHTDVLVTPNHRMLVQPEEKKSGKKEKFNLIEASQLPDTFNILRQISPNNKNLTNSSIFDFNQIEIPDVAFLRLMGWYLSDGTLVFYNETPDTLIISQIKKDAKGRQGKIYSSMKKFTNKYNSISSSLYEYDKKPTFKNPRVHTEMALHIRGIIPKIIYRECGNLENKRIPRWAFKLSKRKMEILLDALIRRDETLRRHDNSIIYYSSLKGLADDVQELAFLCGFETSLYGPYLNEEKMDDGSIKSCNMYQIHISKNKSQEKKLIRSKNIKTIPVYNKRIVCFTVPNGTLVTKLNGHIGIHGNSKHAYHLVRLIRMCKEILTTGKVLVKRPDREELLAIRNGAWTYEQLIEFAENEEKDLNELYNTTNILPNTPDKEKIDKLCVSLVEEHLSKK